MLILAIKQVTRDALAEPVRGRLFFAGEATSRRRFGSVSLAALIGCAAAAFVLTFAIVPVAFAQTDTDPPELIDFDFNPKAVDVTADPAEVTVEIELADARSGVEVVGCDILSQSGQRGAICEAGSPSSGITAVVRISRSSAGLHRRGQT